jgi:hypothetical protein
VTYGISLAILGDLSSIVAASTTFRDLVRESNRGVSTWFLADHAEMKARFEARDQAICHLDDSPGPEMAKTSR